MTVNVETPIVKYVYTAPTTLSYSFTAFEETDLEVRFIDTDNSVTVLALTTDYTVALNPSLVGGDVTVTYVPPGGYGPPDVYIHIVRKLPRSQETDWVNNNPFDMDTLERDLDRAVMLIQEVETNIDEIFTTAQWKGTWATGTYYALRDMVVGPDDNIYMCAEAHTSGTFATDLTAVKWYLFVDVTNLQAIQTACEAAQTAAEAAQTAAEAAETQTGLDAVATAADAVSTAADAVSTAADAASTAADVLLTNADAVSTAADVVSTNADVVTTGNNVTYSAEWATKAEDSLISVAAGGDGATDYSALHWAAKAAGVVTGALQADGSVALTTNWDAGSYYIQALRFVSDVATGTAPLTVTSTTVCTNLNADTVDGKHGTNLAETNVANEYTKPQWIDENVVTLSAGAFTPDGGDAGEYYVTWSENVTVNNPSGVWGTRQTMRMMFQYTTSTAYTVSWGTSYYFHNDEPPVMPAAAGLWSFLVIDFVFRGGGWIETGRSYSVI